ncbi:MAG: hypothetical protein A2W31_09010 [Planctomycetes bacterium RBG_16_64_10]|nr:MAG: hypothetical protein A2W31_09010 [Planctomycetes bacterium RBG_16_64_10]
MRGLVGESILAVGLLAGLAAAATPTAALPAASAAADRDPQWWRSNRHRARFVPGKGYAIEGVAGFFDENGIPVGENARPGSPRAQSHAVAAPTVVGVASENKPSMADRWKAFFGQRPDQKQAQQLMAEAEALFRQRDFPAAATKYHKAAARWPDSPLEEDALFMTAEAWFFADAYPRANDAYGKLLKKYAGTRRLDDVIARQFAIAKFWQDYDRARPHWPITPNLLARTRHRFDTLGHALRTYENIRLNDPTGPRADDALMASATAHFLRGRYDDADYHFDLLRREYPKSEFQFQAHLLGLQCKLRRYQGPEYDGKPLEEADKLVRQLLTQFPDQVTDERERIEKMQAEVAAQEALRDWRMAEYYAKGRHYRAARHYYQKLVDTHAHTKLAERAQVELAKLPDRPEAPTGRLAWLDNLFSERRTQAATSVATAPADDQRRR